MGLEINPVLEKLSIDAGAILNDEDIKAQWSTAVRGLDPCLITRTAFEADNSLALRMDVDHIAYKTELVRWSLLMNFIPIPKLLD